MIQKCTSALCPEVHKDGMRIIDEEGWQTMAFRLNHEHY